MIPDRNRGIRSEDDSGERRDSRKRIFEVAMPNSFASSPILMYTLTFNIT